ncbi:vanadium-dependent haloperoxidase [Flavihumibacter profundi]|uniref:vanadium-dependent haloperoxidase n=1 Tax=Flavihumibacter profundi TaxID=2716883 RepID=UPI001CC7C499|nr:vanadium-dependent haloperoxidase [Flavihumibacter profundi]MBZ5856458.1 vanadium-dependent haloperoxidase [Flavihumibacter profundi]
MKNIVAILLILLTAIGCKNGTRDQSKITIRDAKLAHAMVGRLNDIVIYEIFSPPVASRIYAYSTLALYEASRGADSSYKSITDKLNGFPKMPVPEKGQVIDFQLAGANAFFTIVEKYTFTKDSSRVTRDKILGEMKAGMNEKVYENSLAFGKSVADSIIKRAGKDNYKEVQGMPRYSVSEIPGRWKTTPPDYMDAVQPYWTLMKPLVMDSSSQFKPVPPPAFDLNKNSQFYKEMKEVYDTSRQLNNAQKEIARFWDDNPAVVTHVGHLMFSNKKNSPGGHWINITSIACQKSNFNWMQSARTYALTATAMYDAFISCWDEKYRSQYIRPVTAINESIDPNWEPFLQTPPFPEYTSGHSVASSTIAAVLTKIFGDNFAFTDNYEMPYIGITRSFPSFVKASEEACISRMYGGIHFRSAIYNGRTQGRALGTFIIEKLGL